MRVLLPLVACSIAGCGLVLDLEPPDEGMDATVLRDAGSVSCASDADCDDSLFCNGVERCAPGGTCVAGTQPGCDDTIECTVDACDETVDDCTHELNHAACPGAGDCLVGVCVAGLGCTQEPSDGSCDDSISCTGDACSRDGACVHVRNIAECAPGEICTLTGCTDAPPCDESLGGTDCPHVDCQVATCPAGVCVYTAGENDTRCMTADPCINGLCADGVCAGNTITCSDEDPSDCVDVFCMRTADGPPICSDVPRTGSCDDGDPCTGSGTCSLVTGAEPTCVRGAPICNTMDPCMPMTCSGGTCLPGAGPLCGLNSTCIAGACQCVGSFEDCGGGNDFCDCPLGATGQSRCNGNVCTTRDGGIPDGGFPTIDAGPPTCAPGFVDCSAIDTLRCECDLRSGSNTCIGGVCVASPCIPACIDAASPFCCSCPDGTSTCAARPSQCPVCAAGP